MLKLDAYKLVQWTDLPMYKAFKLLLTILYSELDKNAGTKISLK